MKLSRFVPGLAAALAVALIARLVHGQLPGRIADILGEAVFAVLLGLVIGNLAPLPAATAPGLKVGFQSVLRIAIVLLGARLSFQQVMAIGGKALALIVVLMGIALLLAHALARSAGVSPELASLIGVGTAICGNSAISATAPVIHARDEDVSFAIATNTLFGTIAVFLYPIIGHALGLADPVFGTWAGTAVNDTSQVVAAGFAYSQNAGEVATAVKLTRNALMGAAIVLLGLFHASQAAEASAEEASWWLRLRQSFPVFVVGFLVMALLRTVGLLDSASAAAGFDLVKVMNEAAKFLILVALAAVGLATQISAMRRIGLKAFLLGLAVALTTSVVSLLLIRWLGPAGG